MSQTAEQIKIREAIVKSIKSNLNGILDMTEALGENEIQYIAVNRDDVDKRRLSIIWGDGSGEIVTIDAD